MTSLFIVFKHAELLFTKFQSLEASPEVSLWFYLVFINIRPFQVLFLFSVCMHVGFEQPKLEKQTNKIF